MVPRAGILSVSSGNERWVTVKREGGDASREWGADGSRKAGWKAEEGLLLSRTRMQVHEDPSLPLFFLCFALSFFSLSFFLFLLSFEKET